MNVCACVCAYAQTDTIRYVRMDGDFSNDGRSWATAKNRVQDAINDLRDYLHANNLQSGSVYIAAGTYSPTESTEAAGGSMLHTAFKIYGGIHVYGGFNPDEPESHPSLRQMVNNKLVKDNWARMDGGTISAEDIAAQWDLKYKTILDGNHSPSPVVFAYDSIRGRYNVTFPASSYHVVWFATNGKYETANDSVASHFKPLDYPASLDGCVIRNGNASSRSTTIREHTAYGGGVYMVGNSELRNCTVEKCNATMRGGGVYLDGGGVVEFCYIHTCQSPGVGVVQGYGGGACIDYEGSVGHSHITNCAARCGGGLVIGHIPSEYPVDRGISFYSPFSTACVINNNTAAAEGGGIYLAEGGVINHCTVTANNCIGPDVTYYGRRHGRTGGIYIRDCGMIYNSVFWGNKCATNNDIQFASVRQVADTTGHKIFVYHTAFMNHDISDWTGVQKEVVFSLDKHNLPLQGSSNNFPCFFSPTVNPDNWDDASLPGAGVFKKLVAEDKLDSIPGPRIWHLTSYSALDQKGVQVTDAIQGVSQWILHAHTDYGVVTNPFRPVSTLGALVRRSDPVTYALIAPQGQEGRAGGDAIPTIFIDPGRKGVFDAEGKFVYQDKEGYSWDHPIRDIGEAIQFFRQYLVDDPGGTHHYMLPALEEGLPTGEKQRYDYVQILVKEGTINTAGPGNYLDKNIRTAAVRVESHMRLYGGYPTRLEGTDTGTRNPRDYVTTITANVTGIGGTRGYENNSAHVIAMVNVEHAIVDGFTLADANTHNILYSHSAPAGGGVLVNNVSIDPEKRIDMTGNQLRNCVITNCSSPKGAAVYVNGEHKHADGTVCYAELKMVNCVVRNNMADYQGEGGTINDHGIITANGRAYIEVEHCDVVNNVGYPFKADSKQTESDDPITCSHPEHSYHSFHGFIRVNNSLIFCNGDRPLDNRGNLGTTAKVMSVFPDGQRYVFGEYNMFDEDLRLQIDSAGKVCPRGFFDPDFSYSVPADFLPAGNSFGSSLNASLPSEKNNQAIFTRTDNTASTYPGFVNPSRNVGNSTNGDKPLYGGIVSYAPLTTNPCVNAANASYYTAADNYDRTDNNVRSFGGDPDIGAIENTDLPISGSVIYVTPNGAGKRDGSSWANAIAGNTVYVLNDIAGPALATGDQIDPELTCNRVLDSEGNPILTTNEKYNGGWGRVWLTGKQTGGSATTTLTKTWTTEKNVYDNGTREGEEEIIQDDVYSESSETVNTPGSTPEGFVPGYDYDLRYPYGEISGASRTFWRANPYAGTSGSYNINSFITACQSNGWINNTRAERYVGGLQYAVEKASAANKTYHSDSVQVWVGAGTYNDYKGFIMRDSVTVLGGFPATKYKSPGITERQALMSDVVTIPKAKQAEKLDAEDYETILQISEVNPKSSNTDINPDAIKYSDDDYLYSEFTETTQFEYKSRTIVHHYQSSDTEQVSEDVQDTYMQYANMNKAGGGNVATQKSTSYSEDNDTVLVTLGKEGALDCWHISYPNKENFVVYVETNSNATNKARNIYDPSTNEKIPAPNTYTGNWIFLGNGSMAGLNLWQEMRNMPAGQYRISFDLGGEYKNKIYANDPLNIFVCVVDGNGVGISDTISLKSRTNNKDNNRSSAYRFTFDFNLLTAGNAVFKLFIGDGNKNTKANNPTYGTDTGVDPDEIPCLYVNKANENICPAKEEDKWGTYNPNAREFWLSNIHIKSVIPAGTYGLINTDDNTAEKGDVPHEDPVITETNTYTVQNHRTTLRKRVLTMPDVCVPTYGGGGIGDPVVMGQAFGNDALPHTDRVWGPTKELRTAATLAKQEDPHYVEYNEATWDGFTIRHGFLFNEAMAHGGGAGVNMYEGAHLRNCIVINNFSSCRNVKGGGMFCDGATSTIEGCFVLNNTSTQGTEPSDKHAQNQIFAGGMFMYEGTCFNSLFANNYSYGSAGGLGFCVGRFFNNTIAYNTATLVETSISGGAISLATSSNPNLFVANTIIFGNNGIAIRDRATAVGNVNPFLYCYVQSEITQPNDATKKNVTNWTESATGNYGTGNTFLNGVAPSAANTPFAADFDEHGNYVAGRAASLNDFRLRDGIGCVNKGTEEFAGEFYTALRHKGKTDKQIKEMFIYQSVKEAVIPDNDVAFADRVQDCQIDIGAYEYDGTKDIRPDTTTHPGKALFYITFDSPGGDASGRSPENAACKQKLQKVLDAAGRYKYKLMSESAYNLVDPDPKADYPDKSWTVEVWLEGDSTNCTTSEHYAAWYTPTRSTKHDITSIEDNPLDYSFIVPHGVQVKGGYTRQFYHYENAAGNEVEAGTPGATVVDERDPLSYRSVLSGKITSNTGAEGNCYHVVTFTNNLFGLDQKKLDEGDQLAAFSSLSDAEDHRAVLDGLFIEDGYADSPDDEDRIGAGAIVTGYAHIRNCVVKNNTAGNYGGGLYLKPQALVSGTIIKKNTADVGGGIYIEAPAGAVADSLAHIFTTTICENSANTTAGGMWFYETNARVNSSVLWHNRANDFANVSGTFTRANDNTDYPFIYCGVESRRLEGLGNIELSPSETEGVRWDQADPFRAILYYPIEMSSTLSRSGMTYAEWTNARGKYPTLETTDIAGICRTQWEIPGIDRGYSWTDTLVVKNNDFIEMGARALNKNFEVDVDETYIMRRLYVMHTDLLNSEAARALQDNTLNNDTANMYRQMGSCTLNPFHRLGDAFDYIIATRKAEPAKYRNARFEVYVEKGTYYPYHNAYGEQDEVRTNTFLIPEGTTVIGGINSQKPGHNYGQAGYIDKFTNTKIGDGSNVTVNVRKLDGTTTSYTINYALADSIRMRNENHRSMSDYNLNSIIEPWELERQTILSGNVVSGEDFTHVYHVVTVHADSVKIGPQPLRYKKANPNADWEGGTPVFSEPIAMNKPEDFDKECDLSVSARSIILDGITITGGYANQVDTADINRHKYHAKTYFRGGGIFIDGNWTESFETGHDIPNVTDPAKHNIPIIVRNCMFTDNMAGNGGAIYSNGNIHVYSSHFTQNYSQGPMAPEDTLYIPWSAGGCIAANSYCGIVNVLFDNNEARRGLYPITVKGPDEIPNADARQGFGGVLSIAENAKLRASNCHFMRNKAVAYSAVYNFKPNNEYANADDKQYVFNSIFWGNEVSDIESIDELEYKKKPSQAAIDSFKTVYKPSRSGVFHYDGEEWDKYEKLYHEYDSLYELYTTPTDDPRYLNPSTGYPDTFNIAVTSKLADLRKQGDKIEGLYFCSYRRTYGPSSMRPDKEGYLLTQAEQRAYKDPRGLKVPLKFNAAGDKVEDYENLFSYLKGNNNVLINRVNTAADGPNFKQPSFVAGVDGYMQNADWLLSRINLTTDQGWGHLKQSVTRPIRHYITKYTGAEPFETAEIALEAAKAVNSGATEEDVYPIKGSPAATFAGVTQPDTAMYNFLAARTVAHFGDTITPYIPIGSDQYMTYSRTSGEETVSGEMYRISPNPKLRVEDVYIDMGVYEYQYVQLDLNGNEVDTVWVATTQKGLKHDGLTWETPTTDLQAAIDLLMSSHNNHDKYVCFLGDSVQSFAPTNVIDNRRAFVLTSNAIAPLLPDSAYADTDYAVKSISFLGGYSYDVKDAPRDPHANPTTIEMLNIGHQNQLNQLFVINDMTRIQLQANWMGELTTRDKVAIPVLFDGITFINPYSVKDQEADSSTNIGGMVTMRGGAAIYYRWQRQYETPDEGGEGVFTPNFNKALRPDSAEVDGKKIALPKLTISNCIFMDNGARTDDKKARSSAVRIDQGGGSSLIVNSLFHSNAGAPVYAKRYDVVTGENDLATVPNDVVVMNSTFALNDGHITLLSDSSRVHNSLIWLDDLANDTLVQLELNDAQWDKGANKNRIGVANRVTDNAIWGCFKAGDETYNNDSLSTDNNDVFTGPCFSKPIVDAATSTQRRARNFNLNPGVQTMNRADTTLYRSLVFIPQYPDSIAESATSCWRRPIGFKSTPVYRLANDSDLASKPRLSGIGMERGAYECLAVLQRVLYVQPNRPAATAGDGSSWLKPFGQGQLQNAIDAAAVYTYFNKDADRETRKAYVFVKGSYEAQDKYDIVARDGVNIYGSIPGNFNDTAWLDPEEKQFTNIGCQHYINYVRAITTGVASQDANPTRIASVSTEGGNDYATGFMIDGFVITNPGTALSKSPIIFDKSYSVMRNCIVTDIKTTGTTPVADIQNGLIYNSLFYADTASAIVRLGEHGLLLNNTILTAADTATPVLASDANAVVVNTISGYKPNLHCFAPYLTQDNAYTLPSYLTQNAALAYQLHEHSNAINTGVEMANLPAAFDIYKADSTVHFGHDRDILGNPRRFVTVDKGAFETWRIEPGQVAEITARTNPVITIEEINTAKAENRLQDAFMEHYGGHLYPHRGSVVYLMDSSAITMQYEEEDFVDFNDNAIIFRPGYMLLKPGASFYGNGHDVQMNYLAAEKRFVNQQYSMTAFPFDYSVADVIATTYYPAADSLAQTRKPVPFGSYLYSGAARSVKDYVFHTDNSSAWLSIDTLNRAATQGYLMDFGAATDTLLRFTGYGATLGQYAYVEDSEDKYVYLTQYDNRFAGTGSGLNFTRQEDMGWNMKGLPWLVSNYRTDTILEGESYLRQMYIPHVFYQMDGAGEYLTDGDQMYPARSWDKGSTVAMGNAFFTQTATNKDSEQITFHLPYYARNEKASRPILRMTSSVPAMSPAPRRAGNAMAYGSSDYLVAMPDSTALKNVQYTYGRDAIKWSTNKRTAQLYMLDNKRQTRISLLGNAPTDVDIPLGVKVSAEDQYTFDLPEKEAFADYAYVWLIDYKHNRYTNLKEQDYSVSLEPGENNTRFALRIGKYPKTDSAGKRQYVIYAYQGKLFVRGIIPGDRITVYSPSGKLVHTAIASGYEYSTQLLDQISYVVQVNDVPCKVL